jgi:hypothetical protein
MVVSQLLDGRAGIHLQLEEESIEGGNFFQLWVHLSSSLGSKPLVHHDDGDP